MAPPQRPPPQLSTGRAGPKLPGHRGPWRWRRDMSPADTVRPVCANRLRGLPWRQCASTDRPGGATSFCRAPTEPPGLSTGHTQMRNCWGLGTEAPGAAHFAPVREQCCQQRSSWFRLLPACLPALGWLPARTGSHGAAPSTPSRMQTTAPRHLALQAGSLLSFTPKPNLKTRHVIMTIKVFTAHSPGNGDHSS